MPRAWLLPFSRISAALSIWKLWDSHGPSRTSTLKLKKSQKAKPCRGSACATSWVPKWGATSKTSASVVASKSGTTRLSAGSRGTSTALNASERPCSGMARTSPLRRTRGTWKKLFKAASWQGGTPERSIPNPKVHRAWANPETEEIAPNNIMETHTKPLDLGGFFTYLLPTLQHSLSRISSHSRHSPCLEIVKRNLPDELLKTTRSSSPRIRPNDVPGEVASPPSISPKSRCAQQLPPAFPTIRQVGEWKAAPGRSNGPIATGKNCNWELRSTNHTKEPPKSGIYPVHSTKIQVHCDTLYPLIICPDNGNPPLCGIQSVNHPQSSFGDQILRDSRVHPPNVLD